MRYIRVERSARVTTITLARPAVMNALHPDMHWELHRAFDDFAGDEEQFICVVTGEGERAFCAGSDLKAARDVAAVAYPPSGYAGLIARFDLDKPLIAAVNGVALGGGFELALACDVILASDTARFGLPEPRVGAIAYAGGLHRLARQIGLKPAMGLALRADPVNAAEGLRLGFVNEVVPADGLSAATRRWCDAILANAPLAVRASKQVMLRGMDEASLSDALRNQSGYPAYQRWRESEDLIEGPRAFAEKRSPEWKGR